MGDVSSWSWSLVRWGGVHIRLHAFFLLFAIYPLYLSTRDADHGFLSYGLASLAILFFSVLAHEMGHCLAAFRAGGSADQIVIAPWGGLAQPQVPHEPQHELHVALSGPLVNFGIMTASALALWLAGQDFLALLNPLSPEAVIDGGWLLAGLKLTFWLNWLLVLVNLLPAAAFDGWRILRSICWLFFDYRTATVWSARIAQATALVLCILAWTKGDAMAAAPLPAWVPLMLIAIFLYFSARQQIERLDELNLEDGLVGYDFSQGYTSLERTFDSPRRGGLGRLRRWVDARREARRRRQIQLEQEEERQVDEILARLKETSLDALSSQERALLERVSMRYRNRQRS